MNLRIFKFNKVVASFASLSIAAIMIAQANFSNPSTSNDQGSNTATTSATYGGYTNDGVYNVVVVLSGGVANGSNFVTGNTTSASQISFTGSAVTLGTHHSGNPALTVPPGSTVTSAKVTTTTTFNSNISPGTSLVGTSTSSSGDPNASTSGGQTTTAD